MKTILLILLFLLPNFVFADGDEYYYTAGGNIFPADEYRIELKKEILTLRRIEKRAMQVDVYFEFYNPDPAKKLVIGFVSPTEDRERDWVETLAENPSQKVENDPYIKEFTAIVNGVSLPYKISVLSNSLFEDKYDDTTGYCFVHYFDAEFKQGINIVQHSYIFNGFDYHITTGKLWANHEIEDFELNIYPAPGMSFIPYTFWEDNKKIDWKIIGNGSFDDTYRYPPEDSTMRFQCIHLQSGYVCYRAKHFKPDYEIKIAESIWIDSWCDSCEEEDLFNNIFWIYEDISLSYDSYIAIDDMKYRSKDELKLLKELIYAGKGYVFEDEEITKLFRHFNWYVPRYFLKKDDIYFTSTEREALFKIDNLLDKENSHDLKKETKKVVIENDVDSTDIYIPGAKLYFIEEYRNGKEIGRSNAFLINKEGGYLTVMLNVKSTGKNIGVDKIDLIINKFTNGVEEYIDTKRFDIKPEWDYVFFEKFYMFSSDGEYRVTAQKPDGTPIATGVVIIKYK